MAAAKDATRTRVLDDLLHLMTDKRYHFVDFALVMHHCPLLANMTGEQMQAAIEQNKASVHPNQYKSPHLEHVLP